MWVSIRFVAVNKSMLLFGVWPLQRALSSPSPLSALGSRDVNQTQYDTMTMLFDTICNGRPAKAIRYD